MTNPKCTVCGHINRVGAAVCGMCDTRFDAPPPAAEDFRAAGESYAPFEDAPGGGFDPAVTGALPTDIPAPQFKGVGDVVSPTLEIYRKNFLLVGLFVVATTLPPALLQYAAARAFESAAAGGGDFNAAGIFALTAGGGATLLYWALSALGNALLAGALAYAVIEIQRSGEAPRAADCLRWGLGKMLKVFAVTLITTLLVYIPNVVAGLMLALLGWPMLIPILALLLPWIVLMLTVSLVVPAVAVENRGVFGSLRRSAELTKDFKGLIFLTYFLWRVAIIILAVIVGWSFAYGGGENSLVGVAVYSLVIGMLESSVSVLTLYIFLGILNERRQGFESRAFTPGPRPAAL